MEIQDANDLSLQIEQVVQTEETNKEPKKQSHHSSALYAASMWHSPVNHVKHPNSGHTHLPEQL